MFCSLVVSAGKDAYSIAKSLSDPDVFANSMLETQNTSREWFEFQHVSCRKESVDESMTEHSGETYGKSRVVGRPWVIPLGIPSNRTEGNCVERYRRLVLFISITARIFFIYSSLSYTDKKN